MRLQLIGKEEDELKDVSVGTAVNYEGQLLLVTDEYDQEEDGILCVELTTGNTRWLSTNDCVQEIAVKILAYTDYNTLYAERRE